MDGCWGTWMNEARRCGSESHVYEEDLPIDVFGTFWVSGAVYSKAFGDKVLYLSFEIISTPRCLVNPSQL